MLRKENAETCQNVIFERMSIEYIQIIHMHKQANEAGSVHMHPSAQWIICNRQ